MDFDKSIDSTQHAFFNLLDNWQEILDVGNLTSTILIDHSKYHDTLPLDLLLFKLEAYGFSIAKLFLF